ncbi:MAG: YceD family protein [Parvibaculales bacterium]
MDDSELSLRDDMTLDYVIRVEDVPPTGRDASFEVPEEMRATLTERFGVKNLDALKVDARLVPLDKECVHVTGTVQGRVEQICGVTLEPMWTDIAQSFSAEFQPESMVAKFVIPDDDFETDLPETLQDGAANIGELAIQVFAMEIPAYPRKEGAAFDAATAGVDKADSPFSVLADFHKASAGNDDT